MNAKTLALLLLLSPLATAQPPSVPTVVYLADGTDAEYSINSDPPESWKLPATTTGWPVAPAGFGSAARASEVSTVRDFFLIRLRQRFDSPVAPDSLSLLLKHDDSYLGVYLNGSLVLSIAGGQLPPPDAAGFRHYDLSSAIPKLTATGNLLAIHAYSTLAVPILCGSTANLNLSSIAIDPTATRIVEGGTPRSFRVFRATSTYPSSTQVNVRGIGGNPASLSDFKISRNGNSVPLIALSPDTSYFNATFTGSETSAVYEISAPDDVQAEPQETVEIKLPKLPTSLPIVISRNDVMVTRASATGEGSLRQAIENADLLPGPQTIRFSNAEGIPFSSAPVTVGISNGTFSVRKGITIEGPSSPGRVTIQTSGGTLFDLPVGSSAPLTLRRLVFAGPSLVVNSSRHDGTVLIEDCEFTGAGQALELYSLRTAPVVRRCLFSGNSTSIRGRYGLPPTIENCTFYSGGTCLDFTIIPTLVHCTFAGNPFRIASGGVRFQNCLLTGETADIKLTNTDFDQGGNLFAGVLQAGKPVTAKHPSSRTVSTAAAARLGTLGSQGGFTRCIPILPDSPALDLGLAPTSTSPAYDQRGAPYLRRVGPAPDAGAYELQLKASDLLLSLQTDPQYDPISGLYFQFAIIHNTSPWTLTGFRLWASVLPAEATLYNASGPGFLDVAGPIAPGDYRIVTLQYSAPRPDLRLLVSLNPELLPGSNLPAATLATRSVPECIVKPNATPCLRFPTQAGRSYQIQISEDLIHWRPAGPALRSESALIEWTDSDPAPPARRYYRIADLGN